MLLDTRRPWLRCPVAIKDHHGTRIGGDLAADLAEVMVPGGGVANRYNQRRRFGLRRADRTKQHSPRRSRDPSVPSADCRFALTPRARPFFWPMRAAS